ncbi:hypothetical protein PUN28_007539 [Cardiocondyla obscurior]
MQEPRSMTYPGTAFESMPYRASMMPTGDMPMMPGMTMHDMMDEPKFTSEGRRDMEPRHHHKKKEFAPVNLSVQVPLVYPGSYNPPNYEYSYQPSYNRPTYADYPNVYYQTYGSDRNYGKYEIGNTPYQTKYYQQSVDDVPSITVNAGGPFYGRQSQSQQPESLQQDKIASPPYEELSTATEMINSNNQKRETEFHNELESGQIETTQNKNENVLEQRI